VARPEAYRNPYYSFRVEVAVALSALDVREGFALDILCDYLVDEDPADKNFRVRQEAWLSLWTLTGTAHGVPQDLEGSPTRIRDRTKVRECLLFTAEMRPGVRRSHIVALQRVTPDLERMRAVRAAYLKQREELVQAWARERAEEAGAVLKKCMYYYDRAKLYELASKRRLDSLDDLAKPLRPGELAFMENVEEDPWSRPYVLRREGKNFRILSLGEDGREGTADDITYPETD
jgi:hypothetical protein